MSSDKYSFEAFIERVKSLDYPEILDAGEAACASAERASYAVRGAVATRAAGSTDYARRIKRFLFFMRQGRLPGSDGDADFTAFKEVAECLVTKRQFKPEVLRLFDQLGQ